MKLSQLYEIAPNVSVCLFTTIVRRADMLLLRAMRLIARERVNTAPAHPRASTGINPLLLIWTETLIIIMRGCVLISACIPLAERLAIRPRALSIVLRAIIATSCWALILDLTHITIVAIMIVGADNGSSFNFACGHDDDNNRVRTLTFVSLRRDGRFGSRRSIGRNT